MPAALTDTDREHLRRALALAEGGRGRVSPNPLVGAVLGREGGVIGEGFHVELGGLHAERAALADCRERGEDPSGATMYVTLEPCAHQGRQPPCVEAILEAGVARVVIAADDPSEKAAGRGPGILRDGGVEVEWAAGAEAAAARLLVQPFRKHARTGLPLVTLKLAMSLDGRTATPPGSSPWISSQESRALVHRWRAESDAIAVGIGTALADDPLLTARPAPAAWRESPAIPDQVDTPRQPLRIVFDSAARLPLGSRLVETAAEAPVLVVAAAEAAPQERVAALREAGVEVHLAAASDPAERVSEALAMLGRRGLTSLFLEGGRTLADAFLAVGQIDESRTFFAPMLLGGTDESGGGGPPMGAPRGAEAAERPSTLGVTGGTGPAPQRSLASSVERIGPDLLVTARFREF